MKRTIGNVGYVVYSTETRKFNYVYVRGITSNIICESIVVR